MTVDVYRPPARIGPRVPLWVKLVALWAAMVVVYIVFLSPLSVGPPNGPNSQVAPVVVYFLLAVAFAATLLMVYAQLRLASDGSIVARTLSFRGMPVGDSSDTVRPSDPEERRARRLLKRGAITRREYEKVIARRHFVHGEISRAKYEEIVHELEDTNVDARRGARPPPEPH